MWKKVLRYFCELKNLHEKEIFEIKCVAFRKWFDRFINGIKLKTYIFLIHFLLKIVVNNNVKTSNICKKNNLYPQLHD